jgi:two-component system sensor histidine kinase VicK
MRIGIRWWLALAFAVIAGVTAVAVAQLLETRSEAAFRERASEVAAGRALQAAIAIAAAEGTTELRRAVSRVGDQNGLSLFVFDRTGDLLAAQPARVPAAAAPDRDEALATALEGRRFVATDDSVGATLVALPLVGPERRALLAYAEHPDLEQGLGIVRREVVVAALWAFVLGGTVGFVVATLIARRLKRIAATAAEIEGGRFDRELRPSFMDELGELAATFDRMRQRVRDSFNTVRSERDRLELLLERLNDGVVAVDERLFIDVANERARLLLGTDVHRGMPLPDPWPSFPLPTAVRRLFDAESEPLEATFEPTDDRTYTLVGLPPQSGLDLAIIVITDVSERERRERAEREFVANASHELRTPLTTIRGAIELLQTGAKENPSQRDHFLAHIDRETARLARLIRGLLVLARAQAGSEAPQRVPVPLRPLLENAAGELDVAEDVQVAIDCPHELRALADPDLAEHVVTNLVANAERATEHGRILLRGQAAEGVVTIEIRDTGIGMSPNEVEQAFDRFYRARDRNSNGVGLGLAIVSAAVDAMGGRVEVESAPRRGTIARVILERSRE